MEPESSVLAAASAIRIVEPSASARKLESAALHRIAALTAAEVSARSGVHESSISRIVGGGRGVMLIELQPFLAAIGLKVVPLDHICIDRAHDVAKTHYAEMGMRCEREHGSPEGAAELDWNA